MKKKKLDTPQKKYKKVKTPRKAKKNEEVLEVDPDLQKILSTTIATPPSDEKKIKPKDKVHYVNSKEFEEEIRAYYKSGHVTQKLGESITKIAHGLSYAPNFINYSYKDDMIGDAIVKMFSALRNKKFKLDTGFSPFSYFTTIAFHAFIH